MKGFQKLIVLFFVFVCGFFLFVTTVSAKNYVPNLVKAQNNLGLLGYWPLKEGTGTTTTDFSGNGNSGTLTNMSSPATSTSGWTTTGRIGKAILFDGTDDYVDLGNSSALTPTTALTISAWVKPTACNVSRVFLAKGDSVSYLLRLQGSGAGCALRLQVVTNNGTVNLDSAQSVLTAGVWQYVAGTWDGSNMRVYKNGVLVGGPTAQTGTLSAPSNSVAIGTMLPAVSLSMSGGLDEVRLYNRALSIEEIIALSLSGTAIRKMPTNSGLVTYFPLNEGRGTNLTDFSGNGNNATMANFSSPATSTSGWANGRLNKALNFDGTNDIVTAGTNDVLTENGAVTLSVWMYPRSSGQSGGRVINRGTSFGGLRMATGGTAPELRMTCATTDLQRIGSAGTLSYNKWHHVSVTWDGSTTAANAHIYVDGVEISYATTTNCVGTQTDNSGTSLYIGNSSAGTRTFDGLLDDVRIYNRVMTTAEILSLYKASSNLINKTQADTVPSGLVAYWPFDGKYVDWTGLTTTDVSGNGNTGTLTGLTQSASAVIGKAGQAFLFNGTTASVDPADSASFDLTSANQYTWGMWIKPTTIGNLKDFWAQYDNTGINFLTISANTTTDVNYGPVTKGVSAAWANTGGGNYLIAHTTDNVINTGQWNHITVTYNGSLISQNARFKIYVDGVDKTDTSDVYSVGTISNISPDLLNISGEPGAHFSGTMDEVRYYNRLLSTNEIYKIFCNCGQ